MQVTSRGLFRSVLTGALALGFMGTAAVSMPVAAQGVVCVAEPSLALADGNRDGTVTIAEIDEVITLSGGNADLQAARDAAVDAGVTGVQYTGCTPGVDQDADGGGDGGDADQDVDTGNGTGVDQDADGGGDGGDADQDVDTGNGTGVDQDADGGDTNTDDGDDVAAPGAGDDVSELPNTGAGVAESNSTSWIMMSVGSLMAAAGAFIFRTKKA